MISKISMLAATAALAFAASAAQAAAPAYGAAVLVTGRDCGSKTATQNCGGAGTTLFYTDYEGGPGQTVSIYDEDGNGNSAGSDISFGHGALPEVRQQASAAANTRVNVNAFAFNSFTYGGSAASELSYAGDLHIVGSSGAPLQGNANFAGGAGYFGWIAIWDPSLVSDFLGAASPFDSGYGNYDCSTPGVLAFGLSTGALSGGEQSIHMATDSCAGGAFMIHPGQTVLAAVFLQTPVNRGGWVDASHTFTMSYDPDLAPEVRQNLMAQMVPGAAGVPEPGTWALMLAGFGLVGATVRRRRLSAA